MLEKFGMTGMKKVAEEKFKSLLQTISTPETLDIKFDTILAVVPHVYSQTPDKDRGLRDPLSLYVASRWEAFKAVKQLKGAIAENPDFVIDVCDARPRSKVPPHIEQIYEKPCTRCKANDNWKVGHVTCSCGWAERR